MAQNDPMKKNTSCTIYFPIFDGDGDPVPAAAACDSEYWNGAAWVDCASEATELGTSGIYSLALTAGECNYDTVVIRVQTSTTGAKTTILVYPTAAITFDEVSAALGVAAANVVLIKAKTDALPSGITYGDAIAAFPFMMVLSSDHLTPATGKTVSCTISKNGGAFGATATATATEISGGFYYVPLTATEMQAKTICLKFTATACDQRSITLVTSDIT
jgi:hypothetical protein